jgi:hypothetical protein
MSKRADELLLFAQLENEMCRRLLEVSHTYSALVEAGTVRTYGDEDDLAVYVDDPTEIFDLLEARAALRAFMPNLRWLAAARRGEAW